MREVSPRPCIDIKFAIYKYEGVRQQEQTNLIAVVLEVEIGTGELGLNDLPKSVHW